MRKKMGKLYLVPDRADLDRVCSLAEEYGCAFEYNEFYIPDTMDDPGRQEEKLRWCGGRKEEMGGGGGIPVPVKEGQLAAESIQVEGLVIPSR